MAWLQSAVTITVTPRLKIQDFLQSLGVKFEVLAHSAATISPKAKIAEGSQILAQAVIASGFISGKNCIINHKASVDHETVLGNEGASGAKMQLYAAWLSWVIMLWLLPDNYFAAHKKLAQTR